MMMLQQMLKRNKKDDVPVHRRKIEHSKVGEKDPDHRRGKRRGPIELEEF
jgi:hypothetical protein